MKNIIFILLFTICFSCQKEKVYYQKEIIKVLADDDFDGPLPPHPRSTQKYYVKSKKDSICQTNIKLLYGIYQKNYTSEYKNFEDFLYDALNQKIGIHRNIADYTEECFLINPKISKTYIDFKGFINTYCDKNSNNEKKYLFKKTTQTEDINSISYYLFLNQYMIGFDCDSGFYTIHKFNL